MRAVKPINTTPELVVRRLVHSLGYRYRLHVGTLVGKPDLVFPARRKIIEVRGCFWHSHSCPRGAVPATRRQFWLKKLRRNVLRDGRTLRALRRDGWRVLIVWECQTSMSKMERLRQRIIRFLEE